MTIPANQKPRNSGNTPSFNPDGLDPRAITREVEQRIPALKKLPEQDRIRMAELIVQEASLFSGPLPPPVMLQRYNEALPGLADRITLMAEKQLDHSQQINSQQVQSEITAQARDHTYRLFGMATALVALIGILSLVGWLAFVGQPWLAGTLGFSSMAAIVWMFIHGRPEKGAHTNSPPESLSNSGKKVKKRR